MTTPIPTRADVHFRSGERNCAAWLYLPDGAGPEHQVPIVVMGHGFTGVKEQRLDAFAERFVAAGYACLVFDYRHFGGSEGMPRELVNVKRQLQDWRNAVAFARSVPEADADRVILWGTSFAGGHVLVTAADDPGIAAVISQCPFTDGQAAGKAMPKLTALKLMGKAFQDVIAARLGREPVRIDGMGRPGTVAVMSSPDALPGFEALLAASGLDQANLAVPARVMFEIATYMPGKSAEKIGCPALFAVCDRDSVAPAKTTIRHLSKAPWGTVKRYDVGHFDIYVGEVFERVVSDQVAFLTANVPPRVQ
ncbi:alpha/beta fold hydrolase [Streptomyces sp. 11x1]|uniref:alpha/beta hydrolase n=1 Tax=Streptomyces sp. 11x1 TaxID=3038642 RepID=UPI00292ED678|nr:alpha/beta fold hydrolase [Streptomyces sp. 11x1]WNZ07357.1 alpha/beta fold hydrolase [Streptomyces sp. 11x1]